MILQQNQFSETPGVLRQIEEDLLSALEGRMAIWGGRAATALYWAYRLAAHVRESPEIPEVIVPAIACITPATVALFAGCRVRFADVDPATGMMTLESVDACRTASTCAVVWIHLYGQTADLDPLAAWCRRNEVLLVEDVAQAQGAVLPSSRPAGSAGDLSVFSFNRTKILDCGGGALILRSSTLVDAWRELVRREPPSPEIAPERAAVLALSQRDLYHSLLSLRRLRMVPDISSIFLPLETAYGGLYVRCLNDASAIAAAWPGIPSLLEDRRRKAALYSSLLDGGPWKLLEGWKASGVCWRYSLLVDFPEQLSAFTSAVRRDGFYVSNLYWPLNDFMNPSDTTPNAESFARRIVNLWVDETVSPEWVKRCCESLLAHGARYAQQP